MSFVNFCPLRNERNLGTETSRSVQYYSTISREDLLGRAYLLNLSLGNSRRLYILTPKRTN